MKKPIVSTIIASVVALICTAAICITAVWGIGEVFRQRKTASQASYLTEAQAADYLGIDEDRLVILRKNLKYLEGSYIVYSYTNDAGEEESVCMYSKDQLDKAMSKLMGDSKTNSVNFKYIEEALKQAEK